MQGLLPDALVAFLRGARPCVVATLRADGAPVTVATWYELLDPGQLGFSMLATARRLQHLGRDPRIAVTVLADDWYHHVSLLGSATAIRDDPTLADIDRIARHYTGADWPERAQRMATVTVAIDRWHSFGDPAVQPLPGR
jgi:PPOX class probable F420-dependent enzyme